jgi:hypothetical protein
MNNLVKEFNVYPIPANRKATVNINMKEASPALVSLYNVLGEKVQEYPIKLVEGIQEFDLNTENLAIGMYILNIAIHEHRLQTKIQVSR